MKSFSDQFIPHCAISFVPSNCVSELWQFPSRFPLTQITARDTATSSHAWIPKPKAARRGIFDSSRRRPSAKFADSRRGEFKRSIPQASPRRNASTPRRGEIHESTTRTLAGFPCAISGESGAGTVLGAMLANFALRGELRAIPVLSGPSRKRAGAKLRIVSARNTRPYFVDAPGGDFTIRVDGIGSPLLAASAGNPGRESSWCATLGNSCAAAASRP